MGVCHAPSNKANGRGEGRGGCVAGPCAFFSPLSHPPTHPHIASPSRGRGAHLFLPPTYPHPTHTLPTPYPNVHCQGLSSLTLSPWPAVCGFTHPLTFPVSTRGIHSTKPTTIHPHPSTHPPTYTHRRKCTLLLLLVGRAARRAEHSLPPARSQREDGKKRRRRRAT